MPKLSYLLTATNFTKEQCHEIIKWALASALPAMGINRHFLRVVAHGPSSHQGLDIPNLSTEQLIAHIVMLLHFGSQQNDPTGHLFHLNAEFRIEARLSDQLFQMLLDIFVQYPSYDIIVRGQLTRKTSSAAIPIYYTQLHLPLASKLFFQVTDYRFHLAKKNDSSSVFDVF